MNDFTKESDSSSKDDLSIPLLPLSINLKK